MGVPFLLAPAAALAHEGHHEQMSAAQALAHLVTQPDHLLALGGLAMVAAALTWRLARRPVEVRVRRRTRR
ncbi:HupE/UreJ family protein [Phenylobacterium sp.]|uniref:HupE/UreJ family protein n=1 Tax=Phenylobacterium sp. TaxID=1871053 RepID=UPI0025F4EA38|nr:HupE/UreJ family protein [Phenylobacterium sp.]